MPDRGNVSGIGPPTIWALSQQRRSLLAWMIAVTGACVAYLAFWPSMEGMDIDAMIENLPAGLVEAMGYDQIGTGAGYLNTTVFGLFGPALLMIFATMKGSMPTAGDEEAGVLELELTAPVSRRRLYLGRLAALWTLLAALTTGITALTVSLLTPLALAVAVVNVRATSIALFLLTGAVGSIALAAGADLASSRSHARRRTLRLTAALTVIVLRGPAGAGKSTRAGAVRAALPGRAACVDTDIFNWQ